MSLYYAQPGELGTVGVIDCTVQHVAGDRGTLCGRYGGLYLTDDDSRRSRLPICKWCQRAQQSRPVKDGERQ
jgi:hypothetical protein